MSSLNRKKKDGSVSERREADFYATPLKAVYPILQVPEIRDLLYPGVRILEPCAGDLAIIQALDDIQKGLDYTCMELREEEQIKWYAFAYARSLVLRGSCGQDFLHNWESKFPDLLFWDHTEPAYDLCMTNPPFSIWEDFLWKSLSLSDNVLFLLRLSVLGSKKRYHMWQERHPDIYVLRDRFSFTGDGKTDSDYYAWFYWHPKESGRWKVIA